MAIEGSYLDFIIESWAKITESCGGFRYTFVVDFHWNINGIEIGDPIACGLWNPMPIERDRI